MMKLFDKSVRALALLYALGFACMAHANGQSSPFNGSWKIEPGTLKYAGPTMSVAVNANGFTVSRGGEAQPEVVCDGKAHDSSDSTMTTCTKSAAGYAISVSKGGKTIRKVAITMSADGNTRTAKSEIFPPDGSPFTVTTVSKRVSGGPGFAGEWKEVKFSSSTDSGILTIAVKGNMVAFKETDSPKPIDCKLDGTETKANGGTMSVKLADPHTLKVTYKDEHAKVRRENAFVLSADGKSITETDVTPAPSTSKMVVVLQKVS
jgi:hypothetical protein